MVMTQSNKILSFVVIKIILLCFIFVVEIFLLEILMFYGVQLCACCA